MRCVPVKNGWHTEHTSVLSSVSVDPVVKVLPQRQVTTASVWYSGWISAFIRARQNGALLLESGYHGLGKPIREHRPREIAMRHTRQRALHPRARLAHPHAADRHGSGGGEHVEQPVVVDVERAPLHLTNRHRAASVDGALELDRAVGDAREGEQVETHLTAGRGHHPPALDHLVERVAHRAVVGTEDLAGEGDGADA